MKKVLIPVMALLMLWVITPVMAPSEKIDNWGEFLGSATWPGEFWITNDLILHIKGAEGTGDVTGNLPGHMTFTLNAAIDVNPESPTFGVGSMHGKYVYSDDYGNTFEGNWRTENWGVVNMEGTGVAHGTGDYEGMIQHVTFSGWNMYLANPDYGPNGVYFDFDGIILSPHGTMP